MRKGFSLLELLVVISIIAILAGLGTSTYHHHVVYLRRAQAQTSLLQIAAAIEKQVLQHPKAGYQNISLADLHLPAQSTHYQFALLKADTDDFILTATAQFTDATCPILALSAAGQKGLWQHGSIVTSKVCWSN